MNKRFGLQLIAVLIGFLFVGCSKNTITRRYYILELRMEAERERPINPQYDLKVDVRDFLVASAFDQTRIALRTKSNELVYYYYHHWAVKPSYSVADFVYDIIEQQNMFSRLRRGITYNPDYVITGQVKSIERLEKKKASFAHIHLLLELRDAQTERGLVQYEQDQQLPLGRDQSMNAFASVISEMLINMTEEFLSRIEHHFDENEDGNTSIP